MFVVALFTALAVILYTYFKLSFKYWKNRNVPFITPSIPFGNQNNIFINRKSGGEVVKDFYDKFKIRGVKHGGFYILTLPVYLPVDTNIIKHIVQKDFDHFDEKNFYINQEDEPIAAHLFSIGGERWRLLRQKLSPTFTTGKMKLMLDTLVGCRTPLGEEIKSLESSGCEVGIKEISARFTTDVICNCAFGITCNSFKDPDAEFRKYGMKTVTTSFLGIVKLVLATSFPNLARKLHMTVVDKDVSRFFTNAVIEVFEYRRSKKIVRNDFLQLLMNVNETIVDESKKLTLDETIAQAFVFFVAGFETTSATISFCMFELAQNQEIQNKVRDEINRVLNKYDERITYEGLMEMVYTKQVIDETLRKYPPVPTLERKCTKDYKVPGTDVVLEKDTPVSISTLGLHRDPEHFPEPDRFDPERFSVENIGNVKPFTYMPFGDGPRFCIGLRFGVMQTKVGLITLLKDYRYTLSKKTNPNITFDQGFILTAKEDILLNIEKVN